MKILIIGSNGQLGSDLMNTFQNQAIGYTHKDIEITNLDSVTKAIGHEAPDIVINTAAYHNTDECEDDPEKTFSVNTIGAYNIAKACRKTGSKTVYISTDYVFDGSKKTPYTEEDTVNPLNIYGASKVAGEQVTRILNPRHYIIRCSGLYGLTTSRKGHNFPDLMIKLGKKRDELKVVKDEVLTPTYTKDLSEKIKELVETEYHGTYHLTNTGFCSWYDFAEKVLEEMEIQTNLKPAGPDDFPKKAARPKYSALDNKNLRKTGIKEMRSWQDALRDYLTTKYGGKE
ncbi:MAG TPA: dTDP-4-dehydrorhamnose reductase [Candidatus Altiarchaeales archaeon]|nr:dTDP-4-dehydrorhamnose reductase [Candidatus Altiarchaeales archaeon]